MRADVFANRKARNVGSGDRERIKVRAGGPGIVKGKLVLFR